MFLYMKNGDCIELEAAASAEKRNGLLVFLDSSGQTIHAFDSHSVEAYTADPGIIRALQDELCEDVEIVPSAASATGSRGTQAARLFTFSISSSGSNGFASAPWAWWSWRASSAP